jgi:hypothetical protein
MNERLLRDGCEAIALVGGLHGEPSSQADHDATQGTSNVAAVTNTDE